MKGLIELGWFEGLPPDHGDSMKCDECGNSVMDHGCPCPAEQGGSGTLDPESGNPSTGEGSGSPHAPAEEEGD